MRIAKKLLYCALFVAIAPVNAKDIYVDNTNYTDPCSGSGTDTNPYTCISQAVEEINTTSATTPGTYIVYIKGTGTPYTGTNNVNQTLSADAGSNVTFQSWGPEKPTIDMAGTYSPFLVVESATTSFKNLIIQNGTSNPGGGGGGGIFTRGNIDSIDSCEFLNNNADGSSGGAIYSYSINSISNCSFTSNYTDNGDGNSGGAIYSYSINSISNCSFTSNHADNSYHSGGGAIFARDSINSISNCSFTSNHADNSIDGGGGAIFISSNISSTISRCTFSGNSASDNGNALYVEDTSQPLIANDNYWGDPNGPGANDIYNLGTTVTCTSWLACDPVRFISSTAQPTIIGKNGSAIIYNTITNGYGSGASGDNLTYSATPAQGSFTPPTNTTNSSGLAQTTFSAPGGYLGPITITTTDIGGCSGCSGVTNTTQLTIEGTTGITLTTNPTGIIPGGQSRVCAYPDSYIENDVITFSALTGTFDPTRVGLVSGVACSTYTAPCLTGNFNIEAAVERDTSIEGNTTINVQNPTITVTADQSSIPAGESTCVHAQLSYPGITIAPYTPIIFDASTGYMCPTLTVTDGSGLASVAFTAPGNTGIATVRATLDNGCPGTFGTTNITITQAPQPVGTLTLNSNKYTINPGGIVTLTADVSSMAQAMPLCKFPDALQVEFQTSAGTLSSSIVPVTNGQAQTQLTLPCIPAGTSIDIIVNATIVGTSIQAPPITIHVESATLSLDLACPSIMNIDSDNMCTLTVANESTGNQAPDISNLQVKIYLPGLKIMSATTSGNSSSFNYQNNIWKINNLAPDQEMQLHIVTCPACVGCFTGRAAARCANCAYATANTPYQVVCGAYCMPYSQCA